MTPARRFHAPWSKHRKLRGFTLIELVVVVMLLAVFSVILAELFMVTTRAQREAYKRDTLLHRLDAAVDFLRRDVWAATSIDADGSRVQLPSSQGAVVTWHYSADGTLSRSTAPGNVTQSWGELPPVAFSVHGPLLKVTLKAVGRDETVTLVSQRMEAGGR